VIAAIWRGDPGVIILAIVGALALAGLIAAEMWGNRVSADRGPVTPGRVPPDVLADEAADWDAWAGSDGYEAWLDRLAAGVRSDRAEAARAKAARRLPAARKAARRPRRKSGPDTAIMAAIRPDPEAEAAEARAWWDRTVGRLWGPGD
jgi:hypothetical protein